MSGYRGYQNPKVNTALDALTQVTGTWKTADWFCLALACADQAGLPIHLQAKLKKTIEFWWGPIEVDGSGP